MARLERVMIHAIHDRRIDVLTAGSGNHHLLGAALEMPGRLRLAGKQTGALQDDVDAQVAPRKLRRIALSEHADAIAVHDHRVPVDGDFARKTPMHRVMAGEVRIGLGIAQVVERHDLHLARALALIKRAQDVAPDAAVPVDAHF